MKFKLTLCTFICIYTFQLNALDIWVSPNGSDNNPGTKEQPMQTIFMAQRKVRELRRVNDPIIKDGVNIILRGGKYQLVEPLVFRPEDAGTALSPTNIIAAPEENPIISGGIEIKNWLKEEELINGIPEKAQGKIWVADIPKIGGQQVLFRQMWVNDIKANRASTLNDGDLPRILSVDKVAESFTIVTPKIDLADIEGLEFAIHQWWAIANLRVKEIIPMGDSAKITFFQPESKIEFEHPWPAPFIDELKELNGNSAYYFINAISLLNSPGEWYADVDAGKIYYWPKESEDLKQLK